MPRRTFLISVKVLVDTRGFVIPLAGAGKLGVRRDRAPLAVELAVTLSASNPMLAHALAVVFFLISVFFVWRSFYGMRIDNKGN